MPRIVGHVSVLHRFPSKSMAGEELSSVEVDWQGIEGDRQYGFVRTANATRFPWLTARQVPDLVLHHADFTDPRTPEKSVVTVKMPDGSAVPLDDPTLRARLERAAGEPIRQVARGIYDSMPISIQTTAGHALVEAAHGAPLDFRRFRTNIVIDSTLPESDLHGLRLAFGDAEDGAVVQMADLIPRCVMTTIDPDTAAREPSVLRTIAQFFGNRYGIYASPARPGLMRIGDPVRAID